MRRSRQIAAVLHGARLTVIKDRLEAIGCSAMFCHCFPTGSTPRSGVRPDTHRGPRTFAPACPNRDYTMGHVETRLRACEHNWLPTRHDWAGRRPTGDLV